MEKKPAIVAKRLTELREGIHISQARLAAIFAVEQPAIFRYENAQSFPPYGVLMQYADFFHVSMDYIFGRTDHPQGQLYEFRSGTEDAEAHIREFVEMCFDPRTPANARLKETVLALLEEQKGTK